MATKKRKVIPDGFAPYYLKTIDGIRYITFQLEAGLVKPVTVEAVGRIAPHQIARIDQDLCPMDTSETDRTPQRRRKGRK
jgi:hypothetical protein